MDKTAITGQLKSQSHGGHICQAGKPNLLFPNAYYLSSGLGHDVLLWLVVETKNEAAIEDIIRIKYKQFLFMDPQW